MVQKSQNSQIIWDVAPIVSVGTSRHNQLWQDFRNFVHCCVLLRCAVWLINSAKRWRNWTSKISHRAVIGVMTHDALWSRRSSHTT